ncbi:MAG: hypothetical protein AABX91_02045 [Nanoarchaeota archaeon]
MKNKKGSQVEVVISFVIFMMFLFFIYLMTQPALKSERKDSSLENLANGLVERASGNLTSVSVSITATQDCVDLTNFFSASGIGNKVLARSEGDSAMSLGTSGSSLFAERAGTSFFRVYESGEFAQGAGAMSGCQSLTQGSGYNLGLIKTEKKIFETKVATLINDYNTDYDALKDELEIPQENDFDFSFTYKNGTQILTQNRGKTTLSNVNIYSRNVPIIYTSKTAATESGLLNVKMW